MIIKELYEQRCTKILSFFSGSILVSFFLTIVAMVLSFNYYNSLEPDYGLLQAVTALTYVGLVFDLISIIGTFITSIVMLVKSKNVHSDIKGFVKGVAITAIIISSVSLFFSFLGAFVITFLAYVCFASMLITFGLSIAVSVKYKKIEENAGQKERKNLLISTLMVDFLIIYCPLMGLSLKYLLSMKYKSLWIQAIIY